MAPPRSEITPHSAADPCVEADPRVEPSTHPGTVAAGTADPAAEPSVPAAEPSPATPSPDATSPTSPRWRRVLPGVVLSFAVAAVAMLLGRAVPAASPALVAILLGAAAANIGVLPEALRPGLDVSAKLVLRAGIVLLGFQLALGDIVALGPAALGLIVVVVSVGVGVGVLLGRLLGVPSSLAMLISCGFSICGAAAVAAASGALAPTAQEGESERESLERHETHTATAVALVVVFGTLMILLLPLAAAGLGLDARTSGMWAGASIHEVAQVVAAGSVIGGGALGVAVLVKLGRVVMLAPMIAVLALASRAEPRPGAKRPPLVPLFVILFLAAIVVRSIGVLPTSVLDAIAPVQALCLAAAMFALGTGVRLTMLRQVGGRPVVLAVGITVAVAAVGLAGALIAA